MKVEQVYFGKDPKYPYRYRITIPYDNLTPMETVKAWMEETNFKCCLVPGAVYVREQQDAVLFALKWL